MIIPIVSPITSPIAAPIAAPITAPVDIPSPSLRKIAATLRLNNKAKQESLASNRIINWKDLKHVVDGDLGCCKSCNNPTLRLTQIKLVGFAVNDEKMNIDNCVHPQPNKKFHND